MGVGLAGNRLRGLLVGRVDSYQTRVVVYPMSHSDPVKRAAYLQAWHEKRRSMISSLPKIACGCGCGEMISPQDSSGRERSFANHHASKTRQRVGPPKRVLESKRILCGCGCGETLLEVGGHGNKRRYIYGHTPNKRYDTETPPVSLRSNQSKKGKVQRERKWVRKMTCLRHYGGTPPSCACCGEDHPTFLAIDHIEGSGNKHRKEIGSKGGYTFAIWLIKNNFPEGFQVLCHNCNMAIAILGYCPHKGVPQKE